MTDIASPPGPNAARSPVVRRKHPAQGARLLALASSLVATGGVTMAMSTATHAPTVATTTTAASGTTGSTSAATGSTSTATGSTTAASGYSNGSYTGSAVANRFGTVQVQVTVTNHKITAVEVVQVPSGGKSGEINSQATPILDTEAVSAQSSKVDIVSGATYTSQSYAQSLQAALDKAALPTSTTTGST